MADYGDRYGRERRRFGTDRERGRGYGGGEYGATGSGPARGRDYGRDMLDDMRRFARGDYDREDYGGDYDRGDWERGGHGPGRGFGGWRRDERGSGREERNYGLDYPGERGFFERAGDAVASWMGDEDARRRRMENQGDEDGARRFRGRGPRRYSRPDERIREDVNDRLTEDSYIDASDIDVMVNAGEVTLNGTVDSRWVKRRAEDVAEAVSGVRNVQNNLRIRRQVAAGPDMAGGAGDGI